MCNLYSMTAARQAVLRLFKVSDNRAAALEPARAIFPGYAAPVVRLAADGERELLPMSWGFVLPQEGRAPRRVTNVRDDKILTSRFWQPSFTARRCLVPASSFCEPKGERPATWSWFALTGEEDRPLFSFAGVWRRWTGPVKKDGPSVDIETFAFLTTLPNELVSTINHERMPVLLGTDADRETWLRGSLEDAFSLAKQYPPEGMRIVQTGFEKEDLLGGQSPSAEPAAPLLI